MRRTKIIGYLITVTTFAITTLLCMPNGGWCQQAIGPIEVKQYGNRLVEESSGRIIPQVRKENISASDVKEYLDYRPISSDTSFTKEAFEQRLDEMITSEALYQEALKQNIQQYPKVRRIIHQIFTQRLLEEKIEKRSGKGQRGKKSYRPIMINIMICLIGLNRYGWRISLLLWMKRQLQCSGLKEKRKPNQSWLRP